MKIFGFKAISQGNHTLLGGHAVTKDGNIEFSTAFDHTNSQNLRDGLIGLSNAIVSLQTIDSCGHYDWYVIGDKDNNVRCRSCGFTTPCQHKHYSIDDYNLPLEEQLRICSVCKVNFRVDKDGKVTSQPTA